MQFISNQRVLVQCLHVREELSTQCTLIVTSQRQKKATPPTEERKYTIVQASDYSWQTILDFPQHLRMTHIEDFF